MLEEELETTGGVDNLAKSVREGETDPYFIAGELFEPVRSCLDEFETNDTE